MAGKLENFEYLVNLSTETLITNDNRVMVILDCNCGEDTYKFFSFSFRLFLRRFYLKIILKNTTSDVESWYGAEELPQITDVEFTHTSQKEVQQKNSGKSGIKLETAPKIELSTEETLELGTTSKTEVSKKYHHQIARVISVGREDNIRWEISKLPHEDFINGHIFKKTRMLNAERSPNAQAEIQLNIPYNGAFISPKKCRDLNEKRVLNIFSLILKREICEQDHRVETVTLP